MKLPSFISTLSVLSVALAGTSFVTRYHYVTVNANGDLVGSSVVEPSSTDSSSQSVVYVETTASSQDAAETVSPTTAEIKEAKAALTTSSTQAAATTSSASSSSDSSIYAEISSSGADATFAKAILDIHNQLRASHSAPALSWSSEVYAYAQAYADKYTCGSGLVHSGGKYGENLASGYSSGVAAVQAWYNEGANYDYSSANVLDHFTQVIWKSTTQLGCAYKSCSGGLYVICSYSAAGNFVGQGKANLFSN